MATPVETLEKLERRITISFPMEEMKPEIEKRLKIRAKTAKAPGFRPGKVPMSIVAQQYGYMVETDVLNEKVGVAFAEAVKESALKVAGYPRIEPKKSYSDNYFTFDATFEVYPEITVGDLSGVEVTQVSSKVTEAEIDKTIDILRKQRVHFHARGEKSAHGDGGTDTGAQDKDRVTIDFVGKIDGEEFAGGKAEGFVFVLGEGRMLPEFEAATQGLKAGESKTFSLAFPEDYHGKDVAGKTAEFTITVKKVEWPHLPEIDAAFAKTLGIADGDVAKMRQDIKENLEREINNRVKSKTKESVMDGLLKAVEFDVPKILVQQDAENLAEMARRDMQQRGMKVKDMPFPVDMFLTQAERRVRLGLILGELVKANQLQATSDQIKAQVEEFSRSYEDPQQVVKFYYNDRNRLAEVEALVLEDNVVNHVLEKAKVTQSDLAFDELMGAR